MTRKLQLIGFFVEEHKDGPKIILVQPYVHDDGRTEEIEHETNTPEELWNAFCAMLEDPGKPSEQGPAEDMVPQSDLARFGMEEAQLLVASAAGPTAGRLAGALLRNPESARALGRRAVDMIRKVSRGQRSPRAEMFK